MAKGRGRGVLLYGLKFLGMPGGTLGAKWWGMVPENASWGLSPALGHRLRSAEAKHS